MSFITGRAIRLWQYFFPSIISCVISCVISCSTPTDDGRGDNDDPGIFYHVFPDSVSCSSYDSISAGPFNENAHPDHAFDSIDSTAWIFTDSVSSLTVTFSRVSKPEAVKIRLKNGIENAATVDSAYAATIEFFSGSNLLGRAVLKKDHQEQEYIFPLSDSGDLYEITFVTRPTYTGRSCSLSEVSIEVQTKTTPDTVLYSAAHTRLMRRIAFRKEAADYLLRNSPPALSMPYTEGQETFKNIIEGDSKKNLPFNMLTQDSARLNKLFQGNLSPKKIQFLYDAFQITSRDSGQDYYVPRKTPAAHLNLYFVNPQETFLVDRMLLLNSEMLRPASEGELLKNEYNIQDEYGMIGPVSPLKIQNDSIRTAAVHTKRLHTDGDRRLEEKADHLFFYDQRDRLERYVVFSTTGEGTKEKFVLMEFTYSESGKLSQVKRTEALFDARDGAALLLHVWEADIPD